MMKKNDVLSGMLFMFLFQLCVSCNEVETGQATAAKSCKAITVSLGDNSVVKSYSASIRGTQYVDVRPQVTGVITKILINEGADVKKGQTLFIIDQVPYQAAYNVAAANVKSAESNVATAKLNADSGKELLDADVISQVEYNVIVNTLLSAEAALVLAKAELTNAENNLSYTVVKSPVDGVAGMINYRVGAYVSASTITMDPLVNVTNNEQMHVYFSLSESQILSLTREAGSTAKLMERMSHIELKLNDGSVYNHIGSVDAISGTIDQTTGTVNLRATFDNPDQILRDGGSGRVLMTNAFNDVIIIPMVATFEVQDYIFVYKIVDGKTVSTVIKVNPINNGTDYVVESGLSVGDVIVAEGAGLLREGDEVVVSNK
ncbi:MAG: efflux RND transporter periplasmic adaptor subunit [Rikenellaceae bacterium]